MNDNERRSKLDELAEGFTRAAVALAHVDRRRTTLDGGHEGDDMTPIDRMRFAFVGQPRAARYDGDSESAPKAERCKCGHTDKRHNDEDECRSCNCIEFRLDASPRCTCGHGQDFHSAKGMHLSAGYCVPGCRCSHYEPDGVRGLNGDPTAVAGIKHDRAAQDLKDHDKDVRAAEALLERITARLARFGPARPAGDAERALLARENLAPEPGCSNCGKHGHWQPIEYAGLCNFCRRWNRDTGSEPGARECGMHADGKTVRRPDVNHVNRRRGAA